MSEIDEVEEKPTSSRGETILAKAKAATMIIGAIATACTAVWGAIRQPPEPGAKLAYDVLKEALLYERARREKLEEELDSMRPQIEKCQKFEQEIKDELRRVNMVNMVKPSRAPASVSPIVVVESQDVVAKPKSDRVEDKNKTLSPKLPSSKELGL